MTFPFSPAFLSFVFVGFFFLLFAQLCTHLHAWIQCFLSEMSTLANSGGIKSWGKGSMGLSRSVSLPASDWRAENKRPSVIYRKQRHGPQMRSWMFEILRVIWINKEQFCSWLGLARVSLSEMCICKITMLKNMRLLSAVSIVLPSLNFFFSSIKLGPYRV